MGYSYAKLGSNGLLIFRYHDRSLAYLFSQFKNSEMLERCRALGMYYVCYKIAGLYITLIQVLWLLELCFLSAASIGIRIFYVTAYFKTPLSRTRQFNKVTGVLKSLSVTLSMRWLSVIHLFTRRTRQRVFLCAFFSSTF